MCRACDDWELSGIHRRDFRASKDGPEVMPHKKKSAGKPRKRIDHKHEYVEFYEDTWYRKNLLRIVCKTCGQDDYQKSRYRMKSRGEW